MPDESNHEPAQPPAHLAGGVGQGDFWRTGRAIVGLAIAFADLRAGDRILDVGCGLGRVAWPISNLLDFRGTYDGFDTSREYIEWCQGSLSLDRERFRFHHFDLYSSLYHPHATTRTEEFTFPWPDGAFTFAIATSLFTHLSAAGTKNYLREIARTLQPGGRLFSSFFVLDDAARQLIAKTETDPPFTAAFAEGMYSDAAKPEAAVAFDAQWLSESFLEAGLTFDAFYPGRWRQLAGASYQDIVVAHR